MRKKKIKKEYFLSFKENKLVNKFPLYAYKQM